MIDIHTLAGGHRIGSVRVVLSGDDLERLERAAEATGRDHADLATCAVEEALREWEKSNPKKGASR